MSKARLVITAVVTEGRSQGEVARAYGVSQGWVSRLVTRYQAEGEAAYEPRSRRPRTSPGAISENTVQLIIELRKELTGRGLDAGPHTICWHLAHHHGVRVSAATVSRYLTAAGLVTPDPAKRPRSSYLRFAAELPNECWQSDFTHWRLAGGTDTEIICWLDDHSRYVLHLTAHQRVTGPVVTGSFRAACTAHGTPASTLTDNGTVYTARFAGGGGGRNALEHELRRLGVRQKNGRPNHPQTQGKIERFWQTLKKWLAAQPQPADLAQLQELLDAFTAYYNTRRPHRSLPHRQTPFTAYHARPKATPGDRASDAHDRIRADRVDTDGKLTLRHNGKLHHIGIGRTHARTRVLMLVHDLDVRVINAATGELLRELTIDPDRDYQPTGRPPGPPPGTGRKTRNPEP
jgi:transposase InsO family protein